MHRRVPSDLRIWVAASDHRLRALVPDIVRRPSARWTNDRGRSVRGCSVLAKPRILVDRRSLHEGGENPGVADRSTTRGEDVAVDDREIGQLADLDRADLRIDVVHVRGP